MAYKYRKLSYLVCSTLAATVLSACGGGGDDGPVVDLETYEPSYKVGVDSPQPAAGSLPTPVEGKITFAYLNFDGKDGNNAKFADTSAYFYQCNDSPASSQVTSDWNSTDEKPEINENGAFWTVSYDDPNASNVCVIIRKGAALDKLLGGTEVWKVRKYSDNPAVASLLPKSADTTNSAYVLASDLYSKEGYQAPEGKSISDVYDLALASSGSMLAESSAWLVDKDQIVLFTDKSIAKARLYKAGDGLLQIDENGVLKSEFINLESTEVSESTKKVLPLVTVTNQKFQVYKIPDTAVFSPSDLKGEIGIVGLNNSGKVVYDSRVKTAKYLDKVFADKASKLEYGAIVDTTGTTFRLWAPTAKNVELVNYGATHEAAVETIPMEFDEQTGSWSVTTSNLGHGDFYKYKITVYHPYDRTLTTKEMTDPYSMSLSTDSVFSQVVDFDQLETPVSDKGWEKQTSDSDLANMMIIETHIRDLTIYDRGVSEEHRGKYLGITDENSEARAHIKALAENGATHVEILPFYDFATIAEDRESSPYLADLSMSGADFVKKRNLQASDKFVELGLENAATLQEFVEMLAKMDMEAGYTEKSVTGSAIKERVPNSHLVSDFLSYIKNDDSFNWGYDPWHYGAPEGSYATDTDGLTRVEELRQMIGAYHDLGLNVIMDVVYNHTDGSSHSKSSVLDEIVPWYYNRYTETSSTPTGETCCQDSAAEHKMFAKLMQDTLVSWVNNYGVNAFRFDLMGYLPLDVMAETLQTVRAKTGKKVYMIGEGWDPGANATNSIGKKATATQINMIGQGIGTFNDRLRDAIRGNGPFDSGNTLLKLQGFATGRCTDINEFRLADEPGYSCDAGKTNASDYGMHPLNWQDVMRITMAGALADYSLKTYTGEVLTGKDIKYWAAPTGYTAEPFESVNYVSKHDNELIFDMIMLKSKVDDKNDLEASMQKKARQQAIALASVFLGQAPAFDYQGSDLLRSKSFESDSYNSGDWVNGIRYISYNDDDTLTNGLSLGYTNAEKDLGKGNWSSTSYARDLNLDANQVPGLRAKMHSFYLELLKLRSDYKNYISLGSADLIKSYVSFPDAGKDQTPGMIVMKIVNPQNTAKYLTIVLNASPEAKDASKYGVSGTLVKVQADKGTASISYNGKASTIDAVQPWSVAVFEN
jgi:pullulanase-type alpha-1,6-glucosidase